VICGYLHFSGTITGTPQRYPIEIMDSVTGEKITLETHDNFIEWFFEQFTKQKEKFETGTTEKYTLETCFDRYGLNDPNSVLGTIQFFDIRTRQLIETYEFYKYNPDSFSTLRIWRETVITLRKLEPKGGLF